LIKANHPGIILKKNFIEKHKLTVYSVAKETLLSQTRLSQIIKGERSITAETALKISKFFNTEPSYWMKLQSDFDLTEAEKKVKKDLVLIKKVK
jgi:antitoxin HigA-1